MLASHLHRRARAFHHAFDSLEPRRLMSGGDGGGPDPIEEDLLEPNNSFAAAANLGTTSSHTENFLTIHAIGTHSDVDYFKFTAPSTGTIGVEIDFTGTTSNLNLTIYNSAQQQIGFSDSSSAANRREFITLSTTAGQTYFIKATGTTCDGYSLEIDPLVASFSWAMSKRIGATYDEFGYPIIPNTADYAQPNPTMIDNQIYSTFPTTFNGGGSFIGGGTTTYNWSIASNFYSVTANGMTPTVNLPQGAYTATLTVSNGTTTLTTSQAITVRDFLIVAIGDSYGSGEGNPHSPQQYDFFGFTSRGAKWAQGGNDAETAANRRAHRSSKAGVVKAAIDLENSDPHSSVTLVFLDHTGATVPVGILGGETSGDPADTTPDPAQIDKMLSIIGDRRIDALVMSIGGNDAGFVDIVTRLLQARPADANYQQTINQIFADGDLKRLNLINQSFPQLASRLAQLSINQIFLTEYPDPTHDSSGGTASEILGDIVDGYEVDQNELNQVKSKMMIPLATAMATFAAGHRWTYVGDIASVFATHGYGDWFRTASDSVVAQGPLDNLYLLGDQKQKTVGTLHPIDGGLEVVRNRLDDVFHQPDLVTTAFSFTNDAFLPGATGGYSITVKNRSFLGSAGASVARVYLSADPIVNDADLSVAFINIPALGPGESVTLTGVLPVLSDPFHPYFNLDYGAPVLDYNNQVGESDELDNVSVNPLEVGTVVPEQDLIYAGGVSLNLHGRPIASGQTLAGNLGDEFIGDEDIDIYTITVQAGEHLGFDLDVTGSLDTFIRLFPTYNGIALSGTELAYNDDGKAPGEPSTATGESYLHYTFANAGTYAIVVSSAANGAADPVFVSDRAHGATGSYSLTVNAINSSAPVLLGGGFGMNSKEVAFTFNKDVSASLGAGLVQVKNLTTGQTIPSSKIAYRWVTAANGAAFTFPGYPGALPDGRYTATLPGNLVHDAAGNTLADDAIIPFTVLAGDATEDGRVNFQDLLRLAQNYGKTGIEYDYGNFDYDAQGKVNFADLLIVAQHYGHVIASDVTTPTATLMKQTKRTATIEWNGVFA